MATRFNTRTAMLYNHIIENDSESLFASDNPEVCDLISESLYGCTSYSVKNYYMSLFKQLYRTPQKWYDEFADMCREVLSESEGKEFTKIEFSRKWESDTCKDVTVIAHYTVIPEYSRSEKHYKSEFGLDYVIDLLVEKGLA